MSLDLDALLSAIRGNPEDDLPRLALADWCMEQVDPVVQARGEFIQLRCQAAALSAQDPSRGRMEQRVRDLRDQNERAWLEGLERLVEGWDFERGMVLVEVTHGSLLRHSLDRLARLPGWRWVIGLRGVLLDGQDLVRIAASPHLAQLTSLDLRDCPLAQGTAGIRALADSPHAAHLAVLHLDYCRLGDQGISLLAESPHLSRLTTLSLCNNSIGREGATALSRSPYLSRVVELDLSRNPLGDDGVRILAGSGKLASLRRLSLGACNLRDRTGVMLASSRGLENLTFLDVSDNPFRASTLEELADRFGPRVRCGNSYPESSP